MKKNKMLRLASALLILVMLTTSIVGGTFAKYTTTGTASDTARVAKWGVVINTSGSLFSDAYAKAEAGDTTSNLPAAWNQEKIDDGSITVAAKAANENIVAPGTKSLETGLEFDISGTPEVATKIFGTIEARDIYLDTSKSYGVMVPAVVDRDNWSTLASSEKLYKKDDAPATTYTQIGKNDNAPTVDSWTGYYLLHDVTAATADSSYYPVVYSLTGSTQVVGTTDAGSAQAVAAALAKAMKGSEVTETLGADKVTYTYSVAETEANTISANTDLAGTNLFGEEKLSWEWKYSDTDLNKNKDVEDTILGQMIAAVGTTSGTTAINDAYVVYKTSDASAKYTDVYYDHTNSLAKTEENGDILASLKTSFEITLTVTQVD